MPQRVITLASVLNLRDLGGYRTIDGRTTRWRRLYRSNDLGDLTTSDFELFRILEIKTIIDLRSTGEIDRTGRGLLGETPIRFVDTPILSDADGNERLDDIHDEDYLAKRYIHYLDVGSHALARAIAEIADLESHPMVFNCFFGKDRTGVLAALVLSCVGVERQSVVADYALTSTRMPLILEQLRRDVVFRETIDKTSPHLLAADAATMSKFLDDLDVHHGGARNWALKAGVSPRQLHSLSDALLE